MAIAVGEKHGKLFIANIEKSIANYVCDCGNFGSTKKVYISVGDTKSCGCNKPNRTHSMTNTSEYRTWDSMISRCQRKNDKRYHDYGGRGILVCDEWRKFEVFFNDMGFRPKGMSIDRIDNSKGYYKENCKWSSAKEQMQNRRNSRFVEYMGKTISLYDAQKLTKVSCGCVYWGVNKMELSLQQAFDRAVGIVKNNPERSKLYRTKL